MNVATADAVVAAAISGSQSDISWISMYLRVYLAFKTLEVWWRSLGGLVTIVSYLLG